MYTKNGQTISGKRIVVDGCTILNPTPQMLADNGWLEVVPPTPTEEKIARQQREQRIWALKDQLAQGDYKIIKCAEAQLTGEPMPYDITTLVAERNAMRAEINELEAMTEEEFYEAYPDEREEDALNEGIEPGDEPYDIDVAEQDNGEEN